MWCVAFFVDFGHIEIPRNLNVPPSLRMLGIEPQVLIFTTLHLIIQCLFIIQNSYLYKAIIPHDQILFQTKLNCEILDDAKAFEVRWAIAGKSIVTQLVARYIIIS